MRSKLLIKLCKMRNKLQVMPQIRPNRNFTCQKFSPETKLSKIGKSSETEIK